MIELGLLAERMLPAAAALFAGGVAGWAVQPAIANANPLYWQGIGRIYAPLVRKLYRLERSRAVLRWRGGLVTVVVLVFAAALGWGAHILHTHLPLGGLTQIILIALCLSVAQAWSLLLRLYRALKNDRAYKQAFYALALATRSDLTTTDAYGCARVAITYAVRIFDKGCIAPLFWFIVAGLPGLFIYTALIALVWHVGKDGHSKGFADIPAGFEHIAGFVPGIIAGVLLVIAMLATPKSGIAPAIQSFFAGQGRPAYHEGGVPLAVAAWGLCVTLGGPIKDLAGTTIARNWIGPKKAGARVRADYLKRAMYLSAVAHIITLLGLVLLLVYV